MKFVKAIFAVLIVLALIAAAVWHFYLKEQRQFALVATAYSAKMICSCRFVAERSMDSCMSDFTEDVSQLDFEVIDHRTKKDDVTIKLRRSVTASAPFGLSKDTAVFEPGLGCTLVKP